MMADDAQTDCAVQCRQLAAKTYDLAQQAEAPDIIGDFLAIAAKLVRCAERSEAEAASARVPAAVAS